MKLHTRHCHVRRERFLKTPVLENPRAVGQDLDTCAHFFDLLCGLEDADLVSGERAADGGSESCKASANDQNLESACLCASFLLFNGNRWRHGGNRLYQPTVVGSF